jgi:hypothetical protein
MGGCECTVGRGGVTCFAAVIIVDLGLDLDLGFDLGFDLRWS